MEITPTGGVRIRVNRVLYLLALPFILAYMAASIWLLVVSTNLPPEMRLKLMALGLAGACLSGALNLAIVWLVLTANRLVIDDDGFADQVDWFGAGRVEWREVRSTRRASFLAFKILVIDVHDPDRFAKRGSAVQRSCMAVRRRIYGSPIIVPLFGWDTRSNAIKSVFDRFFDRAVGRV